MPIIPEKDVEQDVQALGAQLLSIYTDFGYEYLHLATLTEAFSVKHIDDV
jgi:hypothetical protein